MDNTPVYIKKVLALLVVIAVGFFLNSILNFYFVLPFCFFTFAFLVSKITGKKPYYLYGMSEAENFLNKKGGVWLLFKWVFGFFGLLYDITAMIINGVFQLFVIFADILLLIKTILYWIIHAILWFLKLFVPPLVFLYRNFLHYLFRWPWWIYKLSYRNTGKSINANFYRVSFPGAFLSLFIFLIFFGAGLMTGIMSLIIPGIAFALLPLAWSCGVISYMRRDEISEESFTYARKSFNGGYDTVRAFLFYLSLILIFILTEILFNLLGWIPLVGFSFLGISLNVNTLLTMMLLFLGVILLFANMILPPYVVIQGNTNTGFPESIHFLGIIGKKFLRYLSSLIPVTLFSFFLIIIPAIIISLSVFLTLSLRDNILDARIDILKEREFLSFPENKAEVKKNIKLLQFYKSFPQKTIKEFAGMKELSIRANNLGQNLDKANEDIFTMEAEYRVISDSLKKILNILTPLSENPGIKLDIMRIENSLEIKASAFKSWKELKLALITDIQSDIRYIRTIIWQLPIVYILTSIWAAFFGGIILTVFISYIGNVFYELYNFREDGRITFFTQTARNISKKDSNQPLLGFTLLIIVSLALIYLILAGIV